MIKRATLYLSFRQREILQLLLSKNRPVTPGSLINRYKLSSKSIANDLRAIGQWLDDRGAALESENGLLTLAVDEQERAALLEELKHGGAHSDFFEKNERVGYVIDRLLLADGMLTSRMLGEELQVSKPTIMGDLEAAAELLARRGLRLERKKGRGCCVSGDEAQLRGAMEKRLFELFRAHHIYSVDRLFRGSSKTGNPADALRAFLRGVDLCPARELMEYLRGERHIDLAEDSALGLTAAVLVMLRRLLANRRLSAPVLPLGADETAQLALAGNCFSILGRHCVVSYNLYELQYLVYKFYRYGVYLRGANQSENPVLAASTVKMAALLGGLAAESVAAPDLERLRGSLYDYLDFVLHRQKLGIPSYNTLYVRAKSAWPQLYVTVEKLSAIVRDDLNAVLSQDEVGMLVLQLAAFGAFSAAVRKVLVVCDRGDIVAKVLARRIANNIPELKITEALSLRDYQEHSEAAADVDFVISTVELPDCPAPVFTVDPIVDWDDLQRIRYYTNGSKMPARGDRGSVVDLLTAREQYSRRLATALSKLSSLVKQAEGRTGKSVPTDSLLGLTIHLTLSFALWESGGGYSGGIDSLDDEDPGLVAVVENFLAELCGILGFRLTRAEAVPIIQYLKGQM